MLYTLSRTIARRSYTTSVRLNMAPTPYHIPKVPIPTLITASTVRHLPKISVIPHTDSSAMTSFIDALASAFENAEPTKSFSAELAGTSSSTSNKARILEYVDASVRDAARDGAILLESGGMSAVAVWESLPHTGHASVTPTESFGPLKQEWIKKVNAAKQRHIGLVQRSNPVLRPHYQLEFLGRNPNVPSVPGAISAVVRPFLEKARKEGIVVWLEAISPSVVKVYEHFGFSVVEKFVIGEDSNEEVRSSKRFTTGIPAWAMIYNPKLFK